jgi:hypothetical protein
MTKRSSLVASKTPSKGKKSHERQMIRKTASKKVEQRFPKGWNEKKVREVIAHYDNQTEEEQAAEIEAALECGDTVMLVPNELVPQVQKLIARHQKTA